MTTIKRFEDLDVWKKSRILVRLVYSLTALSEFSKDRALTIQMRRTSISITSNIAEGFERDGNKEFINFLSIAKGSCGELRSQLFLAHDLNYLDTAQFSEIYNLATEISKSLKGLMQYLKNSDYKGIKNK
jgi:four helix bundle protein